MDKKYLIISLLFSVILIAAIYIVGQFYIHPTFLPDEGALWYYWKLPNPTDISRVTGWGFLIAHLLLTLFFAYKLNKAKPTLGKLNKYNYLLLITQFVFIVLHLIQTYLFYDSLAHDTPVWLSQASVIIMLVMMMILLNAKSGLLFGKKPPIPAYVVDFFRKIHGPYIILALTFTFWYHPMEPSIGHLIGFFYMFLLMIQISLGNTPMHFNRNWVFSLEFVVLIHGVIVAIMTGNGMWPMFASGFGFVAIATQIYLPKLSSRTRILLQIIYFALVLYVYTGGLNSGRTLAKVYEMTWIPITEYLLVVAFVAVVFFSDKILRRLSKT